MEKTNNLMTKKTKLLYAMQGISLFAILFFFAWFIADCFFVKTIYVDWSYYGSYTLSWDSKLFDISKYMSIVFLVLCSLVVICNITYLIYSAFNLKANFSKNVYSIVINALVIFFAFLAIISASEYIKNNTLVYSFDGLFDEYISHYDFVDYLSALMALCIFSVVMTWPKGEAFNLDYLENSFKLNVKVLGIVSIVLFPFTIWLLVPVSLLTSLNNAIGFIFTSLLSQCVVILFIMLFGLFIIQLYRKTRLFNRDNLSLIIVYACLFGILLILFIVSNTQNTTIDSEIKISGLSTTIGLVVTQIVLEIIAVCMVFLDNKILKRKEAENIYA